MPKEKLFSVTLKDCDVQTFSAGGRGGQHLDHGNSAVRVTHKPSGASAESRKERSQLENKRSAFVKMANSVKFKAWVAVQTGKMKSDSELQAEVEKDLAPENLLVETRQDNRWTT